MANLVITFRHPPYVKSDNEKFGFWEEFYIAADKVRGTDTERDDRRVFEGRIKTNFPHELKRLLSTFTPSVSTVGLEAKNNLSASIAIAVDYIKEGSLELGLIFQPVEKLGKLFDNNFEYFETFLKSYIPIAFLDSLKPPFQANLIGWSNVVDQLEIQINPTNEFRNEFQSNALSQASPITNNSLKSKANWLWVISNTSLVIPVLICSIALYLAFGRLTNKENNLEIKTEKLIEQQNALIDKLLKNQDSLFIKNKSATK
jgi:hypothetical protein